MLSSLIIQLINTQPAQGKLTVIKKFLQERYNVDFSAVTLKPHTDATKFVLSINIGQGWSGRIGFLGVYERPESLAAYIIKKQRELLNTVKVDTNVSMFQKDSGTDLEVLVKRAEACLDDTSLARMFDNDVDKLGEFFRNPQAQVRMTKDTKEFIGDVLKTPREGIWK